MHLSKPDDLDELRTVSATIGANRLLVQAAGGNTSIKHNGILWIKASGTQLADALTRDIFVAVNLQAMADDLKTAPQLADQPQRYLFDPTGLRPSIETSLHAVFDARVVLHVHCVNTIAVAIQQNASEILAQKLAAFQWAFVPYVKPGAELARSVRSVLEPHIDVVVMGNHGLLVTGDTVTEAHQLLNAVHAALDVTLPVATAANLGVLSACAGDDYVVLDAFDPIHRVAFEWHCVALASGGSLYPDHVTFCGIGAHVLFNGILANSYCASLKEKPVLLIVPDAGVLIRKNFSAANLALAQCLSDVLCRVPAGASLTYLTTAQNYELLNWDAETYRQQLNA